MNRLQGEIISVETEDDISLVEIKVGDTSVKSVVIEKPEESELISQGKKVQVLFKETEVIIGTDPVIPLISLRNKFMCRIREIRGGRLLSKIFLDFGDTRIISIITTQAVEQLELKEGDTVVAMVKTNEIMLSE